MKKIILTATIITVFLGLIFAVNSQGEPEKSVLVVESDYITTSGAKEESSIDFSEISEDEFIQTLHAMTHQKIMAIEKWGAVEITDEQIELMLKAVNANEYKDENFYAVTLSAWKEGDFSNAVETHNKLWKKQGGSIGRAYRLLNEEEEAKFVKTEFR